MQREHIGGPLSDLNLLRVFATLMEERSVTRAGERLALSQSAVSHALSRLRDALGDPLFVRTAQGMRPTSRAEEIAPGVLRGLQQLQAALEPRGFDAARTQRRFQVAASSYIAAVLMPQVVARLRAEAPSSTLSLRDAGSVADGLDDGRFDLAVGGFARVAERFDTERLFSERMVWALAAGHPAAGRPLAADELAALPQVVIGQDPDPPRSYEPGVERSIIWDDLRSGAALRPAGEEPAPVRMTVPDGGSALALLPGADLAAFVPLRLARPGVEAGTLALVHTPEPTPTLEVRAVWRRERSADPALLWLRGLLREEARDLGP